MDAVGPFRDVAGLVVRAARVAGADELRVSSGDAPVLDADVPGVVIVEDRKTADNGEMVIALLHGLEVTLKKFYRENGHVRLQPANETLQPLIVNAHEVQIQGVVIGVMRRY